MEINSVFFNAIGVCSIGLKDYWQYMTLAGFKKRRKGSIAFPLHLKSRDTLARIESVTRPQAY
jgi:hypothetical protein